MILKKNVSYNSYFQPISNSFYFILFVLKLHLFTEVQLRIECQMRKIISYVEIP